MRPCSIIVALCALIFSSASFGEERSVPFVTLLSSTTVRGYIDTSGYGYWRRHVCRPVRPVRAQRVFQVSTNGAIREIGYAVRCRHGSMFVPNAAIRRAFPTPNRSSGFSSGAMTRRIEYQTYSVLVEVNRIEHRVPPLPPFINPPHQGPGVPPIIERPPGSSVESLVEILLVREHYSQDLSPEVRARLLQELAEIRARLLQAAEPRSSPDISPVPVDRSWSGSVMERGGDRFYRQRPLVPIEPKSERQ